MVGLNEQGRFMQTYAWRKNFTALSSCEGVAVQGKLAFKTKETAWLGTSSPVIALVSIHSFFHEGVKGDLKMNAFMSTIKSHVNGPVTVLISDTAHIRTLSLSYENNLEQAFDVCFKEAQALHQRLSHYFEACKVVYWHSYIRQDKEFALSLNLIEKLYQEDEVFRRCMSCDAEASYTEERKQQFSDRASFIDKATEDLLEQCACLLVLAHKGYRFQFYPGKSFSCTEYVNRHVIEEAKQTTWVHAFVTIEKKSFL